MSPQLAIFDFGLGCNGLPYTYYVYYTYYNGIKVAVRATVDGEGSVISNVIPCSTEVYRLSARVYLSIIMNNGTGCIMIMHFYPKISRHIVM